MSVISVEHGAVPLRVARPAQHVSTGVVVLHQAAGFMPQTESWLDRLPADGHLAVAPLLLHRHGVESIDPMERFGGPTPAFDQFLPGDPDVLSDVGAALDYLRTEGIAPQRIGVLGFSFGGRAAYLVASEHALGGAVTFYGNGIHHESYRGNERIPALSDRTVMLKTPWLGLYGDEDFLLGDGELDEWQKHLVAAPVAAELVRYPGAGHAFDVDLPFGPGGHSSYVAEASADATSRTLDFFRTNLS